MEVNNETTRELESIAKLPAHLAIIEVLESLIGCETLNANIPPVIIVKTKLLSMDSCACYNWYFLSIETETKKLLKADAIVFQLIDHAPHLIDLLSAIDRLYTGHFSSIRIGNVLHRLSCSDRRLELTADRSIKRHRSENSCFIFKCKVLQDDATMLRECCGISNYLHRLKLLHPNVEVGLHVECPAKLTTSTVSLRWSKASTLSNKSTFIDATAQHYTRNEQLCLQPKIVAKSSQVINDDLPEELCCMTDVKLELRAIATMVSAVSWQGIDKCKEVKVFLCGPNGLPMVLPNVSICTFHLNNIISLAPYNLATGQVFAAPSIDCYLSADEPAWSDWHCELSSTDNSTTVHKDSTAGASESNGGLLCIWLNVGLQSPRGTKQLLDLTRWLRANLPLFLTRCQAKLRDAVSSALRSLNDYCTKEANKQKLLDSAVNTMTSAIGSIVSRSTNNEFRNRCFARLQVCDTRELQKAVNDKLWQMAVSRHGVTRAADDSTSSRRGGARPSFRTIDSVTGLSNDFLLTPAYAGLSHHAQPRLIDCRVGRIGTSTKKDASMTSNGYCPSSPVEQAESDGPGIYSDGNLNTDHCSQFASARRVDTASERMSSNSDTAVFSKKFTFIDANLNTVDTSPMDEQRACHKDSDFAYLSQMPWNYAT